MIFSYAENIHTFIIFGHINPIAVRKAKLYTILAFLSAIGLRKMGVLLEEATLPLYGLPCCSIKIISNGKKFAPI